LRKDGEITRRRILEAALCIFGEKGYRDATNAEVCEAAGANIAAVNYHFRSKEQLSREVCEYAIEAVRALYPPEGNISPDAPPVQRLRGHIDAVVRRSRVTGALRHYHSLRMIETFNPTGFVDDLWDAWFTEHREISGDIIAELLGPGAGPEEILRCQLSLMSQCYIANASAATGRFHNVEAPHLRDTEAVIEHIYRFSLAGIGAVAAEIARREGNPRRRIDALAPA
jgi:AcrR family transcriptional regulator